MRALLEKRPAGARIMFFVAKIENKKGVLLVEIFEGKHRLIYPLFFYPCIQADKQFRL